MPNSAAGAEPGYREGFADPRRTPSAELDIGLTGPFSLALAGDCIPSHPIAPFRQRIPGFAGVLDILVGADLCCGNLETSIFDMATFDGHPYCWDDDVTVLAPPSSAPDLAAM